MFKEFSLRYLLVASSHIWKKNPAKMATRCHSLSFVYHSLSLVLARCHLLSLVVPLVVARCTTRCHSLSLVVLLVVTRCTTRFHSLSLDVPLVCLFINDLKKHVRSTKTAIKLHFTSYDNIWKISLYFSIM